MSNHLEPELTRELPNVIPFPVSLDQIKSKEPKIPTPVFDSLKQEGDRLNLISAYKSSFDYKAYRDLEIRYHGKEFRGGVVMRTAFRLVNSQSTCQQCLYAFEVDTYGRGCAHDCVYCYAKSELIVHGYWNNPIPVPVDLNEIRKAFYTAFETEKKNKWADLLRKRIPLRIGSMSDSFMWSDQKYGVTKEFLKILKFYNYPYIVFTRSDLVAKDDYLEALNPSACSVQFSMSSTNDELLKKLEPGAPSAKRRLKALQKLSENGIWTTVRINPIFPIYPDGYYSDPEFKWGGEVPKFDFSSFDMVSEIAAHKVPAVLAGFGRFSPFAMNAVSKAAGVDFRSFFKKDLVTGARGDFRFSDAEIRQYYLNYKEKCNEAGIDFTTCYIGNGEGQFWKDQDLWSNKKDCCNTKTKVDGFVSDCRQIDFSDRLKYTNNKTLLPASERLHEELK